MFEHASDCAINNAPAYKAGPCDCRNTKAERKSPPSSLNRPGDTQDDAQKNVSSNTVIELILSTRSNFQ